MILNLDQVSALLNVSARTVMRLVAKGRFLKPIDFGDGPNFWRESDVREFVEKLELREPLSRNFEPKQQLFDDTECLQRQRQNQTQPAAKARQTKPDTTDGANK